ncbi:MAG: hypothetical protein ACI9E5_001444, partial [Candidatus Omnitrophota bacterium]
TILAIFIGYMLQSHYANRWINYVKSMTERSAPIQQDTSKRTFTHKNFSITPTASFEVEVRLLSKKKIHLG